MSKIRVNTNALDQQAQQMEQIRRMLNSIESDINQAARSLNWKISSSLLIHARMVKYATYTDRLANTTGKMATGLRKVADEYQRTEKKAEQVSENEKSIWSILDIIQPITMPDLIALPSPCPKPVLEWKLLEEAFSKLMGKNDWKAPFGILLSGLTFATLSPSYVTGLLFGKAMGVSSETSFSKSGPGFSVKGSMSAEWSPEKGNAGATIKGSASGSLFTGTMKAQNGLSSASGEIKVGNAAVSGEGKTQLFKDGKLSPEISAKVSGEVSAVKGKVETKNGTDDYNVHAKAEGELLGAKAEAKAGAGKITYKDQGGNTKTGYGVEGSVGAEAYVAQGKVSGGFTIAGIKIGVSVSGKAGGAGVSAGGRVTTGGISGEIGAGLGLGAGIKLDVDWTDFVFFRKKK